MPNPTCPTNCTTALVAVKFNACAIDVHASEIKRVFIASNGTAVFTDWLIATEWSARLAEATTGVDKIRPLTVTGNMPAATPNKVQISNRRTSIVGATPRTLSFTIDEVTTENYEFMRSLECGGIFKIWWETHGGILFGGNSGVSVTITPAHELGGGDTDIEKLVFTAEWRNRFSPERGVSPIYVEN